MIKRSMRNATYDQLCRMYRDNISSGDFNLLTDADTVWLSEQARGQAPKQQLGIPRRVFNRLLKAYLEPQNVKRSER